MMETKLVKLVPWQKLIIILNRQSNSQLKTNLVMLDLLSLICKRVSSMLMTVL